MQEGSAPSRIILDLLPAAKASGEIDGLKLDRDRMRMMPAESIHIDPSFGLQSTSKVWVMREFENTIFFRRQHPECRRATTNPARVISAVSAAPAA